MNEDFSALREYAKEKHAKRVAKNPERLAFALQRIREAGFKVLSTNEESTQIVVQTYNSPKRFVFWAGTGKVLGYPTKRGINNFIQLLKEYERAKNLRRSRIYCGP